MAVYLTYLGSRQYDGVDQYPDENYAREFMQLFTIGLRELRDDGAPTGYETYDNDARSLRPCFCVRFLFELFFS